MLCPMFYSAFTMSSPSGLAISSHKSSGYTENPATSAPGISGVENVTDVDRWPPWRWLFMRPTLYRLAL